MRIPKILTGGETISPRIHCGVLHSSLSPAQLSAALLKFSNEEITKLYSFCEQTVILKYLKETIDLQSTILRERLVNKGCKQFFVRAKHI